jgi:glucose-6-phosphate 1-dehydrogenase
MNGVIFVIFGASGDLAVRKLIPAIFELYKAKYLPNNFAVLGVSRSDYSDEAFRSKVFFSNEFIEHQDKENRDEEMEKEFARRLSYLSIQTSESDDYAKVKTELARLDEEFKIGGNYIYYLSTPPFLYETIPACLAAHGLNTEDKGWKRLVIEKPFGYDLETAMALNRNIRKYFNEDQIYRIDHYLGNGAKFISYSFC